jgi:sodium/bile acid cotransporter 7
LRFFFSPDRRWTPACYAKFVTIVANSLAVLSIPLVLSWLLAAQGMDTAIAIDKAAIMLKIALLVLLPLALEMALHVCCTTLFI